MNRRLRSFAFALAFALPGWPACTAVLGDEVPCRADADCVALGALVCDPDSGRCVPASEDASTRADAPDAASVADADSDGSPQDALEEVEDVADPSDVDPTEDLEEDPTSPDVPDADVEVNDDAPCPDPCPADVEALVDEVDASLTDAFGTHPVTLSVVIAPGEQSPEAALAQYAALARASDSRVQRLTFLVDRRLLTSCELSECSTFSEVSGLGHGVVLDTTGELTVEPVAALGALRSRLVALGADSLVLAGDCTGLAGLEVMEEAGFLAWYEPTERCLTGATADLERALASRCATPRETCDAPVGAMGLREDAVWRPGSRSTLLLRRPSSWPLPWPSGELLLLPGMGPFACASEQSDEHWPERCALTREDVEVWATRVAASTTGAEGGPPRLRATTLTVEESQTVPGAALLALGERLASEHEAVTAADLALFSRFADAELDERATIGAAGVWQFSFGPLLATTKVWLFLNASRESVPGRLDGVLLETFERVNPPEQCLSWATISGANATNTILREREFSLASADGSTTVEGVLTQERLDVVVRSPGACVASAEGSGIGRFGEP